MRARALVWDLDGALRAPWRLVVFLAAALAAFVVLQGVVYPIVAGTAWFVAREALVLYPWLFLAAFLVAHLVAFRAGRAGEGWRTVGLGRAAARPATLVHGFLVGALAILLPSLGLMAACWLRPERGGEGSVAWLFLSLLVVLAPAALWEELLARGYPFAVLRRALGLPAAVLLTSIAFGLLHLQNEGANLFAVGQVVFAGVWLAGVLVATGSLYAAWTAHLGWNWTMAAVLHTPVSGIRFDAPGWRLTDAGPDWATGGAWGPEAGLGATLGMAASLIYLFARQPRREETLA